MGGKETLPSEKPHPLSLPKEQDFAPPITARIPTPPSLEQTQQFDTDSTETNSSDELDSDEEEKETGELAAGMVKAKRFRWLWLRFLRLSRWFRVLLIGSIGVGILIAPLLVVNLRFRTNAVRLQVHVWSLWLTIIWSASCITFLVVDAVPSVSLFVIRLFGGQVERLKSQMELTMAVTAWLKLVLDIAWAWISLSVIRTVYRPPGSYWIIINRVLQAFFTAGMVLLAEKLFLQFVAINFHEKALAERLAENRLGLKALDRLSNATVAPPKKSPNTRRGHKSPGSAVSIDALANMNQNHTDGGEASPILNEKELPGTARLRVRTARPDRKKKKKAVTSVIVDQVGGAIGLKNSKFNRETSGGLYSARRLARKLFSTLSESYPPRTHLVVEDFEPYFHTTTEAHAAFALFDKDGNGDITRREMREAVQRIYRERKALNASLKDVSSIVAKLDGVMLCVAAVIIIFVCLLIFNRSNTLASLVPLATIILGFSFIFGNSAKTLFESLIFIFSTHVFDVGDLVMIDDQVLFVKEFGLFSTTFRRVDGQEVIAPNALLASAKLVHNLRRSKSMWESTTLTVAYDTPIEVIEQLRMKIQSYITTNSREWSGFVLNIDKMEFQNAVHLMVCIEHRPNWQDWGGRWERRTAFMRHLKNILEELDIRYTMPVQPVLLPNLPNPGPPQNLHLRPTPNTSYMSEGESLGSAGSFRAGGDITRAPGMSFQTGAPYFK